MFDHISIGVANLERAAAFYDASLAALGYVRLFENKRSVCYGPARVDTPSRRGSRAARYLGRYYRNGARGVGRSARVRRCGSVPEIEGVELDGGARRTQAQACRRAGS